MGRVRDLATRINAYRRWLARGNTDRPLTGLFWEPDIPALPAFLDRVGFGNEATPEDIRPAEFFEEIEAFYQQERALDSDVIQGYAPAFGMPWMEALAGCPVAAQEGSLWAEPALKDYAGRAPFRFDPDNRWFQALARFTQALVEYSGGRFAVTLPQMRGPLDILAALRTPEQLCLDLIDRPNEARAALDELTELWIDTAQALLRLIPPFGGGYASRMKMWAPGPCVTPQNDVSALLAPRLYASFLSASDAKIAAAFPYSCFHVHSTEHRHLPGWLEISGLSAIEFTLEHTLGGLAWEPSMRAARQILARKPLVLAAPDVESAEGCLEELPPAGLSVLLWTNEPVIPESHREWLERRMSA